MSTTLGSGKAVSAEESSVPGLEDQFSSLHSRIDEMNELGMQRLEAFQCENLRRVEELHLVISSFMKEQAKNVALYHALNQQQRTLHEESQEAYQKQQLALADLSVKLSSLSVEKNTSGSSSSPHGRDLPAWMGDAMSKMDRELEHGIAADVCVFHVPKSLSSVKPEAYTPHLVGLGPYHHLQPELSQMERIKVDAAKRVHKGLLQKASFTSITDKLAKLDPYVRACYHKFLDIQNAKKLSWMMAIDALFLFDLLCCKGIDKKMLGSSPYLKELVDPVGKKLAEDAILRDVMMLENQIPIFFLEKLLRLECSELRRTDQTHLVDELLPLLLLGYCEALSPIKETIKYPFVSKTLKRAHLLDLLYSMVVQREEEFVINIPEDIFKEDEKPKPVWQVEKCLIEDAPTLQSRIMPTGEMIDKVVEILPIPDHIKPVIELAKGLLALSPSDLYNAISGFGYKPPAEDDSSSKPPAEDDTSLPTASSLSEAGVKFREAKGIRAIRFDEKTPTLELPVIKLSVNSEVVMRNLVAYEAMATSGTLVFANYLELMNGLIDTAEDVKVLKENIIIAGQLKDEEVATLFNGMSKSIDLTDDPVLNGEIEKVIKFYKNYKATNNQSQMGGYVFGIKRIQVVIATIILLAFSALQAFCSAYNCKK